MYNAPPTKDSVDWPFGLILDICIRLGLGKSKPGFNSWKETELIEKLELSKDSSTLRNWKTGGGISDRYLDKLVQIFTKEEEFSKEWELVLRHCALNNKPTRQIQAIRKQYFGVTKFSAKQFRNVVVEHNKHHEAFTLNEIESFLKIPLSKPISNIGSLPKEDLVEKEYSIFDRLSLSHYMNLFFASILLAITLLTIAGFIEFNFPVEEKDKSVSQSDIDFLGLIFTNIQMCKEEDFDHDLNKCLKASSKFPVGIQKINISFESTVVQKGTKFEMHWYRYGERFHVAKRVWTETFAKDLRYASTFWSNDDGTGYKEGRYQIQLFIKEDIVGEIIFEVR